MPRCLTTKSGEDRFYTPKDLAINIVNRFNILPTETYLEPCLGEGAFFDAVKVKKKEWCEIDKGIDFLSYDKKVDWIITNPPFSIFKAFLSKCLEISDNVVFLCPINHFTTKARVRLIQENGFYLNQIILIPITPVEFPQSGFQWGVVWLRKGEGLTEIKTL